MRTRHSQVMIANAVWDPKTKNSRPVIIKSLGFVDKLEKEHGDAMAYAIASPCSFSNLSTNPKLLIITGREFFVFGSQTAFAIIT